jgi:hypothetical protein
VRIMIAPGQTHSSERGTYGIQPRGIGSRRGPMRRIISPWCAIGFMYGPWPLHCGAPL